MNSRLCRRRVAVVSLAIVSTKYDVDMIVLEGSAKLRMESPHVHGRPRLPSSQFGAA